MVIGLVGAGILATGVALYYILQDEPVVTPSPEDVPEMIVHEPVAEPVPVAVAEIDPEPAVEVHEPRYRPPNIPDAYITDSLESFLGKECSGVLGETARLICSGMTVARKSHQQDYHNPPYTEVIQQLWPLTKDSTTLMEYIREKEPVFVPVLKQCARNSTCKTRLSEVFNWLDELPQSIAYMKEDRMGQLMQSVYYDEDQLFNLVKKEFPEDPHAALLAGRLSERYPASTDVIYDAALYLRILIAESTVTE